MSDNELRGLLLMAISAGQMNKDKHPMDILEEILREEKQ